MGTFYESIKVQNKNPAAHGFGHLNLDHWILPFDVAQGDESLDSARDPEPVEGLVEPFRIFDFPANSREVAA